MALNANKIPNTGGGNFKRPPALEKGSYPARLVQVIDLGLQSQRPWKGEEKPPKYEIYTTYEILDEFLQDEDGNDIEDKPRWISERLPMHSLDADLAKSTKRFYALDPGNETKGDWAQLVGFPCIVTISADKDKKGKVDEDGNPVVYNNISSIQTMRAKDAQKAEGLKNPPKVLDQSEPDISVYLSLPDWLRSLIKEGLEFEGSPLEQALEDIDEAEEIAKRREALKEEAEAAKKEKPEAEKKPEVKDEPSDEDEDW